MQSFAQLLLSLFATYWIVIACATVISVIGVLSVFISRKEALGLLAGATAFGGLSFVVHKFIWA